MPTPSEIMDMSAAVNNDTAQENYSDVAQLPYLNMALNELQEIFEQNDVPITHEKSAILNVPAGTTIIGLATTPALPTNLIDIKQLWESTDGTDNFTPMTPRNFIPSYMYGQTYGNFGVWAWMNDEINLPTATINIDLKIDYIKSIFATPILIGSVGVDIPIKNILSFLGYRTGALCAEFIGEDEARAEKLNNYAVLALERELGISAKSAQTIVTRRRPFRSSYKRNNSLA